ncbi:MAG: protein kinase [Planctomycetes bacterium]|nr:protein kinase [Planctomycetota bacterium]MCW8134205.1 protein kinase [Planctomycetota bacterium]
MPVLKPDEILRYLAAKGFLSAAEVDLVNTRWSVEKDGPLLQYLGREKLVPPEVAEDLLTLIGNNQLEGLEPHLPGLILLNMIGRGGRGSVYRAWQPSLKRVVAVKILSRALADNREYIQRFLREARVASKVQHRNIVRAMDINKKGTHTYMVMEYVPGTSLGTVLRNKGKLELPDAIEIARAVGDALGYIAKVGLVHRDIKPDNIMIDRRGRVKLCDLGLARPSGATNLTSPMVAQGTPAYMAPETAVSPEIDTQADVYALGVTLYRALLGKIPFDNPDPVEILRMHVEEQPRGLEGGDMPGAVSDLIRRMLEKDPRKRPPARELGKEVAALQKTIPGLDKHKLWDLVPGGEPTLPGMEESLALEEDLPPPSMVAPAVNNGQVSAPYKAWEDPALAPRPALTRRSPMPGIGVGTMGFALFVCVVYILFQFLSGPPEPVTDEAKLKELEARVKQLESDVATAQAERKALSDQLKEAAERLKAEDEEDIKRRQYEPQRQKASEAVKEITDMRETGRLARLPGQD